MTIIAYIRVSTTRQASEGQSLEAQEQRIRSWASQHGHKIGQLFCDSGLSGGRADNRPELQKAIQSACDGKATLVVVSLSRLARSTLDAITIFNRLEQAGAQFVSLSEQLDTSTAAGKMIFRIMAVLAEFERELISERTSSVLQHMREQGLRLGGSLPFGYDMAPDGVSLVANPKEQSLVREMKDMRQAGASLKDIVDSLALRGIKTKTGKDRWQKSTVKLICETAK